MRNHLSLAFVAVVLLALSGSPAMASGAGEPRQVYGSIEMGPQPEPNGGSLDELGPQGEPSGSPHKVGPVGEPFGNQPNASQAEQGGSAEPFGQQNELDEWVSILSRYGAVTRFDKDEAATPDGLPIANVTIRLKDADADSITALLRQMFPDREIRFEAHKSRESVTLDVQDLPLSQFLRVLSQFGIVEK